MSKTIDEKVVSMRFDNQQFERGVKQTQNSVQDLKKSLIGVSFGCSSSKNIPTPAIIAKIIPIKISLYF